MFVGELGCDQSNEVSDDFQEALRQSGLHEEVSQVGETCRFREAHQEQVQICSGR